MINTLRNKLALTLSIGLTMAVGNEGENIIARDMMASGAQPRKTDFFAKTNSAFFNAQAQKESQKALMTAKRLATRHNPSNLNNTPHLNYHKPAAPKAPTI